MARPVPDPKETKARAIEVEALVAALGGRNAAVRAAEAAGTPVSPDTLKKIVSGDRHCHDPLLTTLRSLVDDRPRWLLARSPDRQKWLIHNHAPGFTARLVDGELSDIKWHAGSPPPARQHGALLSQAAEFLGEQ